MPRKHFRLWLILGVGAMAALAQTSNEPHHTVVRPRDLQWKPTSPPGTEIAVLTGDPSKPGEFVLRLKMADGTRIPPHWHPADEHVTVMRGVFAIGSGILFDETKLEDLQPGIYVHVPKEMRHFALAKGETVVQIQGLGPFVTNWVNPSDVPGTQPRAQGDAPQIATSTRSSR